MKLERQAVILAGGRGSRLEPFNRTTPKPLIKIAGKPIIEYNMQSLLPYTDGFVIVVGYLHEQIEGYFGDNYQGKPISYVFQGDPQGTGHSLLNLRANRLRVTGRLLSTAMIYMILKCLLCCLNLNPLS